MPALRSIPFYRRASVLLLDNGRDYAQSMAMEPFQILPSSKYSLCFI